MLIADLVAEYLEFAEGYYVKPSGRPTGHYANLKSATRDLVEIHGETDADAFRCRELREVRDAMIARGVSRKEINKRVGWIRGVWKWAVGEDLAEPGSLERLRALIPLTAGRCGAVDRAPVPPVAVELVRRTLPHLGDDHADMVRMLLATGMRPGEVRIMRTRDIERTGEVWFYVPHEHKTEHKGCARRVPIVGPAIDVLLDRLSFHEDAYVFSPDAGASPYGRQSLGQAIRRACDRHELPGWSPNQIRHTVATILRREAGDNGLEAARALAGHTSVTTTEIYAEFDSRKAVDAVRMAQAAIG